MGRIENERVGAKISEEAGRQNPWEVHLDSLPVERVAVALLNSADSPRLIGESVDHVRILAESDEDLPPILVHRSTMRVVDGMHRLRATLLRGEQDIAVRFLDGHESDVFVVAVRANTTHGLPLSRADRNAAATRIIRSHPQWSDRMIAVFAGLSPKTVGAIRRRLGEELPPTPVRIGHDGRARPVDGSRARVLTGEIIKNHPDATLRQIAEIAGISRSTARDVRKRVESGEPTVLAPSPQASQGSVPTPDTAEPPTSAPRPVAPGTAAPAVTDLLSILKRDPSVRFTEHGRLLLRLLDAATLGPDEWHELIASVPTHCKGIVANVARACGEAWFNAAQEVSKRPAPE
jgi:hypothetical protein